MNRLAWHLVTVLFVTTITACILIPRHATGMLFAGYFGAFACYLLIVTKGKEHWRYWLAIAIATRLILIFFFPNLSDDIYRFIWDGNLVVRGVNPFIWTPSDWLGEHGNAVPGFSELYPLLNSPDYHSVYPAVCQLVFALSAAIAGFDERGFTMVLKLIFFAAECATLRWMYLLLAQRGKPHRMLIYALNPLILVELMGNLHFETLMICFLMAAYFMLERSRNVRASVSLALAIGTKMLPLLALPPILRRVKKHIALRMTIITSLLTAVLLLPVITTGATSGFLSGIDLYFHTFEFNAGIYYVLRWLGYVFYGYNLIASLGTVLAVLTTFCLLYFWIWERQPTVSDLPGAMMITFTIYFLLSTTVHPWYLCTLVACCVFTRSLYAVVWCAAAFLSYAAYAQEPPGENMWFVAIEYVILLGWIVCEWKNKRLFAP